MEDIKLWELDGTQAKPLGLNSRLESEGFFEDTLVKNPELLIDGMTLVGRQTPTEGGPLDLLGVDSDGKLVVFELKRGTLSRDAVAQIIDYASDLDSLDLDALADRISEKSGAHDIDKIENFQEWYNSEGFGELESLKPLRLFLVGLGADDRTERMVRFLAQNSGMDISLLTFHAFDYDGKTILAKQVEVEAAEEPARRSTRRRRTQEALTRDFDERMERFGVRELVDDVRGMFIEKWPTSTELAFTRGIGIRLDRSRQYARIDAWKKETISIAFFAHTKALCLDEFREPVSKIRYVTERGREPVEDPRTDIHFHLTPQEWETHKQSLTALVQAVYTAWQNQDEDDEAELAQ